MKMYHYRNDEKEDTSSEATRSLAERNEVSRRSLAVVHNGRSIKPGVAQNAIVNRSILQEKITKKVTAFTEELVAELVKKYGISLPDNTLL